MFTLGDTENKELSFRELKCLSKSQFSPELEKKTEPEYVKAMSPSVLLDLVPKLITDIVKEEGTSEIFITGSRRFGVATKDSDLDVVVQKTVSEKIKKAILEYLPEEEVVDSNYFDGWSFEANNDKEALAGKSFLGKDFLNDKPLKINIIGLNPIDYLAWEKIAKINDEFSIFNKDKSSRILAHGVLFSVIQNSILQQLVGKGGVSS